jgi:hypothetical protein
LRARDLTFTTARPDARPAVRLEDVAGAEFDHLVVASAPSMTVFVLRRLTDFLLRNSPGLPDIRRSSIPADTVAREGQ